MLGHRLSSNGELYGALALDVQPKLFPSPEAYSESRMAATQEPQITRPRQSEKSRLAVGQNRIVLGEFGVKECELLGNPTPSRQLQK